MSVKDLVKELVGEINSLKIDLDCANYKNEKLKDERTLLEADIKTLEEEIKSLEQENEALKKKIEDLEF